jgi:Mg-chelatase subunit ChlD
VRPSVDLLHTVLSLAGGLPEAALARLRPLVARLVAQLTALLANRMRPALAGLTTARPTRRRTGTIDLAATIRANLRTARRLPEGRVIVLPERLRYRERARRSMDWRLVLVTDVSGSMEESTVWAALTSAVLSGLPALNTHFLAFSTEVIDLSDQAHDPLGLLLEVRVGGGTDIAGALRHARTLVTVPARTMVVVVSDFEEGAPLQALLDEVRTLAASGCHLLGCASLDDQARPRYAVGVAQALVGAGMPVAALSPLALARWVADQVR